MNNRRLATILLVVFVDLIGFRLIRPLRPLLPRVPFSAKELLTVFVRLKVLPGAAPTTAAAEQLAGA